MNKMLETARTAFNKIFKNTDPFGKMFNYSISNKLLLSHTNGYYLNKKQFKALMNTIKEVDEDSFFLTITEDLDFSLVDKESICGTRVFKPNITYEEYEQNKIVLENAIYSKNGTWGILISHEDHAVIGGSNEFIKIFKQFYTCWEDEPKKFIKKWRYNQQHFNSDISWIPEFLKYINE